LDAIGYNNYYAVLNTKDYGIPQNRERVFIISIRKDIDIGFTFPDPMPLTLKLKDLLEDEVDEKYYLEGKFTEMVEVNENYSELIGGTIGKMTDIYRRCYNENGTAPTLHTCPGGNTETKIYRSIDSRVRKLTPAERFRLMGFSDRDCEKVLAAGISDTQINKQTGNSISVNVLEAIYRSLGEKYEEFKPRK
jgi:DNA (cytosine-5)-methyltransferase 1